MLEQQELRTKLWTKSFIALTISALFLFMNLQMLLSSFPSYVKSEFQAGDIMVSLVTSVFALTAIASRFMTAFLMRKVSRNVLLYIGLAIAAAITGLYVVADSIGSLLLMRVGYGIGFGIASTIIPTIVSQIIPSKRMGEGIGYFGLSTSLAMSIGPMIGLNVMKQSGFGTLAMIGMVTLLLAFPVLLFSRSLPAQPKKKPTPTQSESTKPLKVPFNTKLVLPAILNVMLAITYGGLLSFIALFGESVHLEQVGLFFLFNAVTIIIIRPISGRLFDKRGPASVLIPAAVCVVASLTVLSYTTSMPMLIVSALLYGLGFGAIQPTIQAWMLRTSTPAQYGMANSMFYNSTDLGVASGAIILGAISAATDYGIMYRYSAGFMVLFLIVYVGIQINKARVNPSTLSQ
ncbi:MFS transporter [Paenibacillus sp. FSL R5-0887]|jgi:predicted MFS family arabinose efflux permease|uniref:MFS transporter n=1 Tax=Paenibacillus TaxID=44249 RepID=UPI00096D83FD|nr:MULTISPECIES: MFS transporter [Paenibacillus]MDH6425460.1 putative MFS family arabinose efflux permease [Paenibacillus sp. PastH-4]MDH6441479.1 putative MFS family arabinose efflux permease [Paenibacillus sp. PastF-4]MDH6530009.1 putative MFS family arabinose efflux permease [Paenibacillus sp. PastH-3]OMD51746.1 MFS transporter [Paenibacillus odorifer]OMD68949.1 MFS transporter [Paenibacillus odorifer]